MVVGARPERVAPWGSGRAVDVLGARGPPLCWRLLEVRFRGMTGKLTRFRVVLNAFRGPHCRLQPPHLHRWFCASAASLQWGPTWLHSVSALSVPSADPWGCALVRLASLAGLGPAPLPFAAFCLLMSRAGPGGAPCFPPPPTPRTPAAARSPECERVTGGCHACTAYPPGDGEGGSECAMAVPDVPG